MARRIGGQALKGHLDLLLLTVLSTGPLHGYAVIDGLRVRSGDAIDLPEGTVYPALHRLEERGLLASTWDTVGGRRRRMYEVTTKGARALEHETEHWREFTGVVNQFLGGVAWNAT